MGVFFFLQYFLIKGICERIHLVQSPKLESLLSRDECPEVVLISSPQRGVLAILVLCFLFPPVALPLSVLSSLRICEVVSVCCTQCPPGVRVEDQKNRVYAYRRRDSWEFLIDRPRFRKRLYETPTAKLGSRDFFFFAKVTGRHFHKSHD